MEKIKPFELVIAHATRNFFSVNWPVFAEQYLRYQHEFIPRGVLWWFEDNNASSVVLGYEGVIDMRRSIANISRDIDLLRRNKAYTSSLELAVAEQGYLAGGPGTVTIVHADGYLGLCGVPSLAGYVMLCTTLYCLGDMRRGDWKRAVETHNPSILVHMRLVGMEHDQYNLLLYQITQLVDYATERVKSLGFAD